MEKEVNIDWSLIILNLRSRTGYAVATIASKVGSNEKHLNRIVRGEVAEPKFSTAMRILDYHYDVMGEVDHRRMV